MLGLAVLELIISLLMIAGLAAVIWLIVKLVKRNRR